MLPSCEVTSQFYLGLILPCVVVAAVVARKTIIRTVNSPFRTYRPLDHECRGCHKTQLIVEERPFLVEREAMREETTTKIPGSENEKCLPSVPAIEEEVIREEKDLPAVPEAEEVSIVSLFRAIARKDINLVRMLIESNKLDLNEADPVFGSAIVQAVLFNCTDALRALLERDVDVHKSSARFGNAIELAVRTNDLEKLCLLLEAGADVNDVAVSTTGCDKLIQIACQRNYFEIAVRLLQAGADTKIRDKEGRTLLHQVAKSGYAALVSVLLTYGMSPQVQDPSDRTPLHYAARAGHAHVALIFLEHGALISEQDDDGRTPLMIACAAGHVEVVRIFLEAGTPRNQRDRRGRTALYLAARLRDSQIVRMLLEAGADANIADNDRYRPCHVAHVAGNDESLRLVCAAERAQSDESRYQEAQS